MTTSKADKIELQRISDKYGVSIIDAENVVESMYGFIRETIVKIDFKEKEITKDEFAELKTNFNIPCIGKFCASYYTYKKINKIK